MGLNNVTWNVFNTLENDQMSIVYLGKFVDQNTDFILNLSEKNLEGNFEFKKLKKKVSFLIVENFQNIIRHGDDLLNQQYSDELESSSYFCIRSTANSIFIISANKVDSTTKDSLKFMIENLNKLDNNELKVLYLQILNNSGHSDKGGSGLGLIEMARKSGQKLTYSFEDINQNESIFYLQIILQNSIKEIGTIDDSIVFRKYLIENKILFVYKGDFSEETVYSLMAVFESNLKLDGPNIGTNKKAYTVLVELLQNISKHGHRRNDSTEGILVVKIEDGKFVVSIGNWILANNSEKLSKFIDHLNGLNLEEIKDLYRKNISSKQYSDKEGTNVGLINMIRFTKNKINYLVKSKDQELNFLSITITI